MSLLNASLWHYGATFIRYSLNVCTLSCTFVEHAHNILYIRCIVCLPSVFYSIYFFLNELLTTTAEDKFPVWFTYLASKADYSLHVSPSSLSASHKHPLAPVQPLMCNVQHVCNQGNNWLEALWSDEPTGSPPLIGSILRQETIKEPFLPPPILIDFSSMSPFTKHCLLLPPCSRRQLLDEVPLPHFCLICLFPWKWICATQGVHACASCLENTIIHPFLHKSLSDPPLPSRTPSTTTTTRRNCSLLNQEVCAGNSCPPCPPTCSCPGASWEWSNVWPTSCGWQSAMCRYSNQDRRDSLWSLLLSNLTNHALRLYFAATSSSWELIQTPTESWWGTLAQLHVSV